jgi:hypothetical protein
MYIMYVAFYIGRNCQLESENDSLLNCLLVVSVYIVYKVRFDNKLKYSQPRLFNLFSVHAYDTCNVYGSCTESNFV